MMALHINPNKKTALKNHGSGGFLVRELYNGYLLLKNSIT